jgi:exopolyphosphatase/guanosine-5'-triphosphate,3'-diphosphate pyrophosphatase
VSRYRAVATSAARNAANRAMLLRRVDHEAGIELEIIDGDEEARLVRRAITHAFRDRTAPNLVVDLGGGSLEVEICREGVWDSASLPVGTVRLIETFGLSGAIGAEEARMIRRNVATILGSFASPAIGTPLTPAVVSGGNGESLAAILGKSDERGMPVIEFEDLEAELPTLLAADVPERMERYGVKRDRAEVMAGAALVLATVGAELKLRRLLVPGVGVRDGIVLDLAEETVPGAAPRDHVLLAEARSFASRLGHDVLHGDHVRGVARALFDQLGQVHGLPEDLAVVLELAALLHDIGEVVHRRGHHRHGEYIIRWARIPGLESPQREMVAALVRGHRKSAPDGKRHESYAGLSKDLQRHTRRMEALLRLADALDTDRRQRVTDVRAVVGEGEVFLDVRTADGGGALADLALRKADLFESEFGLKLRCAVNA